MSEPHPFLQIVRVASSAKPNDLTGSQKIVAYDLKRRKAMEVPKLNFIMRDFKYYCVDFDESAVRKLERIVIEDRIAEKRAPVDIEYSVRCEKDQEHQLVNALKGSDQPARMIDDHVLKVLRDATLEKAHDKKSFLPNFSEWSKEIARRIEQELPKIGLKPGWVKVKLHPKPVQDTPPAQLVIRTPLRDYGGEVTVTLNLRWEVDTEHEIIFLLADNDPKKLEDCLARWSKSFFSGEVGITRLDTAMAEVAEGLRANLNLKLAEFGKIKHLDFQFDFPFKVPPRQCPFVHVVPCPIRDISNPVKVKHEVLVRLVDLGKWVKARSDDPQEVLKNAIAEATHSAVFNNTYLQVIKAFNQPHKQGGKTDYNEAAERIKAEVKAYAETIGYAVEHLISVPDIQPLILQREGLKCSIDQEFGLQDPRIKGRLLVDIFAQLPDLDLIEDYLRPGVDLVTEVQTRTIRVLEPELVKTSPARFYTEFMVAEEGKKGVAEELSGAIKTLLSDKFKLEDSHISVRMGETELARRAAQLARGQHETTVTFLVGSGEHGEEAQGQFGAEDMSFVIRYAIDGIDGQNTGSWYCFQARDYETPEAEVSAINQVLNDELTILLNQLPVAALRSIEFQRQDTQNYIKQRLVQKIVEDFGVVITISAVVRRESKTDAFNRQASDFRVEAVTDQLAQAKKLQAVKMELLRASYEELFRKQHELAVKDPTDPLLGGYDKRLEEMEKTLKPEDSHAAMLATHKTAPKIPSGKPVSILEHLNNLDGGENAKKNNGMEKDKAHKPEKSTEKTSADIEFIEIEVFYGTDRKKTTSKNIKELYGTERGELSFGTCLVNIPKDHRMGKLEAPRWWKLQFSEDLKKHVVLSEITPQSESVFFEGLCSRVKNSEKRDAFVFVHGYNVSFEDAARRTAQMAYDLGFDGAPIFYSWPSQGKLFAYTVDETNVEWSIPHLQVFLADIASRTEAEIIHLIAHSMGSRALGLALQKIATYQSPDHTVFKEIVLSAPDIDADVFKRDIVPGIHLVGSRITLYASSEDKALQASKEVHGNPRAGDSNTDSLVVAHGVDTIDASAVDVSFLGHSYYGENRSIISDMYLMLHSGLGPKQRNLIEKRHQRGVYWAFRS